MYDAATNNKSKRLCAVLPQDSQVHRTIPYNCANLLLYYLLCSTLLRCTMQPASHDRESKTASSRQASQFLENINSFTAVQRIKRVKTSCRVHR